MDSMYSDNKITYECLRCAERRKGEPRDRMRAVGIIDNGVIASHIKHKMIMKFIVEQPDNQRDAFKCQKCGHGYRVIMEDDQTKKITGKCQWCGVVTEGHSSASVYVKSDNEEKDTSGPEEDTSS